MSNIDEPSDQKKSSGGHLRSNSYDRAMSDDHPEVNQSIVKNPPPESDKKSSDIQQKDDDIYIIKWIEFNQERLPILLQNVNGPCPLLAIANILLLRKQVKLFSIFLLKIYAEF
jgi:hypothetical protein